GCGSNETSTGSKLPQESTAEKYNIREIDGMSCAYYINLRGDVLGKLPGSDSFDSGQANPSAFWRNGNLTEIAPGTEFQTFSSLNDEGQVTGTFRSKGVFQCFLWQDSKMTLSGVHENCIGAINNRGQSVGTTPSAEAYVQLDGTPVSAGLER